jgi:hypothetical protein
MVLLLLVRERGKRGRLAREQGEHPAKCAKDMPAPAVVASGAPRRRYPRILLNPTSFAKRSQRQNSLALSAKAFILTITTILSIPF